MNKYEIEKRCREEMQQSIPDTDALWQRIESQLPEKPQTRAEIKQTIRPKFRKLASTAALFLLAAAGLTAYLQMGQFQKNLNDSAADSLGSANSLDSLPQPSKTDAESNRPKRYADLQIMQTAALSRSLDLDLLGTTDMYFSEEDVLRTAGCFVDIIVENGIQDPSAGLVAYTMQVVDVYGDSGLQTGDTFTVSSSTAYVLEIEHEYVLPLYKAEGEWQLAGECAPQMERTLDGKLVFHSGWYTLMDENAKPLLYDSRGEDDYFYDRMYLTDFAVAESMLRSWAEEKKA